MSKLREIMSKQGVALIGASQTNRPFTVVASGGTGLINITAAAHELKKHQDFYIAGGAYAGIKRVLKVISANVIQVAGTFGATATGNLSLLAAQYGHGFIVDDPTALVIEEFEPDDDTMDVLSLKDKTYIAGQEIHIPFKKLRISGGDVTVVRKSPQAVLTYTNR